jgi:hypothetical protein
MPFDPEASAAERELRDRELRDREQREARARADAIIAAGKAEVAAKRKRKQQ